jgi:hypothetical protein
MKSMLVFSLLLVGSVVHASSLENAFQDAMSRSNADLQKTKTTIMLEQEMRLASWNKSEVKEVIIPGTAAVDSYNLPETSKKVAVEYQDDTERMLKSDLNELNK